MKIYNIGIIGCGSIAAKMAATLGGMKGVKRYAVASRTVEKAKAFAEKWQFAKAYGSYEELASDAEVDLIYIATPHAMHYDNARLCIEKGKPVLCEKAFTANARQAADLLKLAEEKKVFLTEAIWTRYMPLSLKIRELLEEGVIGTPHILSATMYFGKEVASVHSVCQKTDTGVDAQENITLLFKDGKMAALQASIHAATDRMGIISGDKGHLIVENINNPQSVKVLDTNYQTVAVYDAPQQITGYEYQVYASLEAIEKGWLESPYMPHAESLRIMQQMDALRREWGVVYPCDNE